LPIPMTAQTLSVIHKYLSRVVAHGPEQDELIKAVEAVEKELLSRIRNKQIA